MEKILVTGGAGFIGYHTADYFLSRYPQLKAILVDNFMRAKLYGIPTNMQWENIKLLKERYGHRVEFIELDIRDHEKLCKVAKNVHVIAHIAAQVGVPTSIKNPRLDYEINTTGTFNVLEAARKADAIVIYCSTNKVYGENVNKIPIEEHETRYDYADPKYKGRGVPENFPIDLSAHTPYGVSKLAGDLYTQEYHYTYGLKTGVFRMSCIYGERQLGIEEQGWVAWFVKAAIEGKTITIYGTGKQVRDILYVKDLIKAWDLFINKKEVKHGVYNTGGGPENTISLVELIKLLEEKLGRKMEVKYADWRLHDQKVYYSDITKLQQKLNWKPEVDKLKGVEKLIEEKLCRREI
ncbi:MAG: nucleoside-diphosphate sugar epimerase [Thermoprotei archaeon]|nr:MAG: nucleoside-diphosphate sugar epimerase [Thermoprotei archaeon]